MGHAPASAEIPEIYGLFGQRVEKVPDMDRQWIYDLIWPLIPPLNIRSVRVRRRNSGEQNPEIELVGIYVPQFRAEFISSSRWSGCAIDLNERHGPVTDASTAEVRDAILRNHVIHLTTIHHDRGFGTKAGTIVDLRFWET